MRNFFLVSILSTVLIGCNRNSAIELELLSNQINCANVKPNNYYDFLNEGELPPESSRTVIEYKLTNNSDKTFFFNVDSFNKKLEATLIKANNVFVKIVAESGENVRVKGREPSREYSRDFLYAELMNYGLRYKAQRKNFIIHPKETLYFEWFLVLPYGNLIEDVNYSVKLDPNKKYSVRILMSSDSTDIKNKLSRADLKTVSTNGYEIYDGVIESKNTIPIIFK